MPFLGTIVTVLLIYFFPRTSRLRRFPCLAYCGHAREVNQLTLTGVRPGVWPVWGVPSLFPIISDNDRVAMGHAKWLGLAGGTSLQGLIVLETIGWAHWARQQAALIRSDVPPLVILAVACSPCFWQLYVEMNWRPCLRVVIPVLFGLSPPKKKHCHCNILPGMIGQLNMSHVYVVLHPSRYSYLGKG